MTATLLHRLAAAFKTKLALPCEPLRKNKLSMKCLHIEIYSGVFVCNLGDSNDGHQEVNK